jgi:hypothetical protein
MDDTPFIYLQLAQVQHFSLLPEGRAFFREICDQIIGYWFRFATRISGARAQYTGVSAPRAKRILVPGAGDVLQRADRQAERVGQEGLDMVRPQRGAGCQRGSELRAVIFLATFDLAVLLEQLPALTGNVDVDRSALCVASR